MASTVPHGARSEFESVATRMKSNLSPRIVRLIAVLWLAALAISAQSGRSWMKGMVFDESETHGISGALVELTGDPDSPRLRSRKLTTNTNDKGSYSFREVPYGDYTFRVSATGFTNYEVKIYIASDALTELHVKLKKQK